MKLFFFFRINAFPHHHLSFSFPVLHFKCIASMLRQAGVYKAKFFPRCASLPMCRNNERASQPVVAKYFISRGCKLVAPPRYRGNTFNQRLPDQIELPDLILFLIDPNPKIGQFLSPCCAHFAVIHLSGIPLSEQVS